MFFEGAIFWHHQLLGVSFQSPAADIASARKIFVVRCKECIGKGRIDTLCAQGLLWLGTNFARALDQCHPQCCRRRGAYFALSLGGLIGTCREVLTTLGLPSRWVWLMTVSRTRKNFSASMCVAPLTMASLVLLRLAGSKFNHLSESAAC